MVVPVEEAAALWRMDRLVFECAIPADLADYPEFPLRLRGAFGRALDALQPETDWRGRPRPRAYDGLFRPLACLPNGDEVPRPLVFRAERKGDRLVLEVRLFGVATFWRKEAAKAMSNALTGGISLAPGRGFRRPLEVLDTSWLHQTEIEYRENAGSAALMFRSPVAVRQKAEVVDAAASILRSIPRRVQALAPWQSLRISPDAPLSEALQAVEINERDLTVHHWSRNSVRQGDTAIPMKGYLGTLRLQTALRPLLPYLAIAAMTNTGSHASMGLGWFDLVVYP